MPSLAKAFCCGSASLPIVPLSRKASKVTPQGSCTNRYVNPEGLREVFESGAICLLRGSYLVDLYENGGHIKRRQDLPLEAFWTAEEAMAILTDQTSVGKVRINNAVFGGAKGMYFLIALSYRWTEPGHPDMSRHHLRAVAQFVKLHRAWAQRHVNLEDNAVFWDFPCLLQKDRTSEEEELFHKGLGFANLIYGHVCSMIVMQQSQPAGLREPLDYSESGWCQFESSVGALNKWSAWYQDISVVAEETFDSFEHLISACARNTKRPVPLTPERMAFRLDRAKFTNGKTDRSQVERMYADIANAVFDQTHEINFNNQAWTSEEVARMAEVLPRYAHAKKLCLWGTDLGEDGAAMLAPAFKRMKSLREIYIDCSVFGADAHESLVASLPPNLHLLKLSNVGGNGTNRTLSSRQLELLADALAEWIREPTSPKSIDIKLRPPFTFTDKFVGTIEDAWKEAGKDLADLVLHL